MKTTSEFKRVLSGLGLSGLNPGATDGREWFAHGKTGK